MKSHDCSVLQVRWLSVSKNAFSSEAVASHATSVPFLEDVLLAVHWKHGGLVLLSVASKTSFRKDPTEYDLVPKYSINNQATGFTSLKTLGKRFFSEQITDLLLIPTNDEVIRCIAPNFEKNTNTAKTPFLDFIIDISKINSYPGKKGDLMVFLPFIDVSHTQIDRIAIVTGHEGGQATFWSVELNLCSKSHPHSVTIQSTLGQMFMISEKPILCVAANKPRMFNVERSDFRKFFVALGTMDGKVVVFQSDAANYTPFASWKLDPSFRTQGKVQDDVVCSVQNLIFNESGSGLIILTSDSKIRQLSLQTGVLCEIFQLPSLGIAYGLNRTSGLHCIAILGYDRSRKKLNPIEKTGMRAIDVGENPTHLDKASNGKDNCFSDLIAHTNNEERYIVGDSQGRILILSSRSVI
ncbi:hypothetical protein XU18_3371 [Perkinsela sp. CCAP 1560/4]|nr:hypothetical protein XU18_3371 [Perkinsela sp. CCAP 1560/4]|eukprot:KNH05600.1 hypothetical protein XU18_3371 [Perkinsela sp. CCAP 1560/4]